MLSFDVGTIKSMRRKVSLSQSDLASLAGVSQSLIAKIEAGRIDPSLSNAKRIFEALSSYMPQEASVRSIMTRQVLTASMKDPLSSVIALMRRKGISQVPIIEKGKIIGIVTERSVLNHIDHLDEVTVDTVMLAPAPIVDVSTPASAIIPLLQFSSCVLVFENGSLAGMVTKSDLMGAAIRHKL